MGLWKKINKRDIKWKIKDWGGFWFFSTFIKLLYKMRFFFGLKKTIFNLRTYKNNKDRIYTFFLYFKRKILGEKKVI